MNKLGQEGCGVGFWRRFWGLCRKGENRAGIYLLALTLAFVTLGGRYFCKHLRSPL